MVLLICDTANTVFDFTYLYNTLIVRFGVYLLHYVEVLPD